ncbi:MAG: site-specific DNA-methyltransferase [Bacteroidetes bacterium]|nr:site-specific DNA-methyltransferase [Bacteroidota bacterium]
MPEPSKPVEALTHDDARRHIPTAEAQALLDDRHLAPLAVEIERRNPGQDPQLVWRGKDTADWSDLVVHAPPLYIQEKVHPKALIDDLRQERTPDQTSLFDLFDTLSDPSPDAKTEFYQHDAAWSNRMILGDSLQVMASLAEREGLRGKVQCIYLDPPYGIKFNSNFQWSTTSRDVKDGKADHITREPEQVKAFRDTWRDGIHSYLTYLRDRLAVARELLTESGSIFVQIGDENVHRVRALMDEVFGEENFVANLVVQKTTGATNVNIPQVCDFVIWYSNRIESLKYRPLYRIKDRFEGGAFHYGQVGSIDGFVRPATNDERNGLIVLSGDEDFITLSDLQSASMGRDKGEGAASWFPVSVNGVKFRPTEKTRWKTNENGMNNLLYAGRASVAKSTIRYKRKLFDFSVYGIHNIWTDIGGAPDRRYVVETTPRIVERCILMATDPGDLVLDPTCGSGTTAFVAEQWGRRWITIDTSRVALALARARIMGARYPYYLLADSRAGQQKEAELTRTAPSTAPVRGSIRQGFVYERVPHVTLKSIANNAEIDVIYAAWQPKVEDALARLNAALRAAPAPPFTVVTGGRQGKAVRFDAPEAETFTMPSGEAVSASALVEWEVPREAPPSWPDAAGVPLADFWAARIGRQKEIDASIAAKADVEYLYDRPYEDKKTVRVAGPFTVESLTPHRTLSVGVDDDLLDPLAQVNDAPGGYGAADGFVPMIVEALRASGVQQAHKDGKIDFTSLTPWPGQYLCAEGRYEEATAAGESVERRAGVLIGPEFGTVSRPDLVEAAREAAEAGFDVLVACAFNYDAHATELTRLGRVPILKARMNADLHMADALKNTGKGNLFVVFGEPDLDLLDEGNGMHRVQLRGVDVFHPASGEVRSDGPDGIACWFVDTDYNGESFFVRHAYFLGANDPYKALKTTLKAEIDEEAWASLHSDTSRPFSRPASGRIAVKVINHLGDEVMKVFRVP